MLFEQDFGHVSHDKFRFTLVAGWQERLARVGQRDSLRFDGVKIHV